MTQTEPKEVAGFETTQRTELEKIYKWIFELGAAALVLFYIYSAGFGSASEQFHLGFYLLLTFALIGIFYRCRKNSPASRPSLIDLGMIALSIFTIGYWIVEYPNLANRAGNYSQLDIFVGAVAILISFEVSRRTVGWALPIIAVIGILYALFGRFLPDVISHRGLTPRRIIEYCFFQSSWGLRHHGKRDGDVRDSLYLLRSFSGEIGGRSILYQPTDVDSRTFNWRSGESFGHDLRFFWLCRGKCDCKHSRYWNVHDTLDETERFSSAHRWCSRSFRLRRRAISTTRDGSRCVSHGRTDRTPL